MRDMVLVILAMVFTWSGGSKLVSGDIAGDMVAQVMSLPRRFAAIGVRLFALAELVVVVTLVVRPGSMLGVYAVIGLGLVVAGLTVLALLRGKQVKCGCFGAAETSRLGAANLFAGLSIVFGGLVLSVLETSDTTSPTFLSAVTVAALNVALCVRHRSSLGRPIANFRAT